jgi:choline monooxygenase
LLAIFFFAGGIMSDVGQNKHLEPANSQPNLANYLDEKQLAVERDFIFNQASLYIGHEKGVPQLGDWRALSQENMGRVMVRTPSGLELVSNICRHRQGLMLGNQAGWGNRTASITGNLSETGGNIVCPLHRWTYNPKGELLGAPHFPQNPCLNLERFNLQNCHGLHFEGPRDPNLDIGKLFKRPEFDFSNYVFDRAEVHPCHYNWKTFIEVYLEDYHVEPFHPGLGSFVSCDDLTWEFDKQFSLQRVGVHRALSQPGSEAYRIWHDKLLSFRQGQAPNFGAIWVTYFPTHMIELYPHTLVLSTLYPVSAQETLNVVEFYYPEEIASFEREFVEAQQAAYMETAVEDDEIAERMDAGRKILHARGQNEVGPYQSPMEDGMQHFHEWYARMMREQKD